MRRHALLASLTLTGLVSANTLAAGINDYALTRTFTLPTPAANAGGNVLFDAMADGRLLAVNGTSVLRETAVGSGTFATLGTIGNFTTSFGATFLTVSPDGTKAAVGNNNGGITVFNTATPATATAYAVSDFDAAWADNNRLAVSNFNGVQILNTATGGVSTVVSNIGGFSGGIAFDAAGNLFAGNGGDSATGGTDTGWVKSFSKTAWEAAITSGTGLNFETGGTAVVDLLTAGSIGFDNGGNFFVGGGDFYTGRTDVGYAGLVDSVAIANAIAAGAATPPINSSAAADVLRKFVSPPETLGDFPAPPAWAYNEATGELYLRYVYGDGVVQVYSVPEPGALAVLGLPAIAAMLRRRRKTAATIVALAAPAVAVAGPFSPGRGGAAEAAFADAGIPAYVGPAGEGVVATAGNGNVVNPVIQGWATGYVNYLPSDPVGTGTGTLGSAYAVPTNAIGPSTGSGIVSLGDRNLAEIAANAASGQITLTFASAIRNGPGADFAAFENGFVSGYSTGEGSASGQMFAEFGLVEVSTDGVNFARFPVTYLNYPNASLAGKTDGRIDLNGTGTLVSTAFLTQDVSNVRNVVGKHANGAGGSFGTPFNLDDLQADPLVTAGLLDLQNVNYVRIVDIAGDGSQLDIAGRPIFDAWVTSGSGGLDLDAVAVINQVPEPAVALSMIGFGAAMLRRRRR